MRVPARSVLDLLAAREAVGDEERIAIDGADGG
jgi:hypothetical protein